MSPQKFGLASRGFRTLADAEAISDNVERSADGWSISMGVGNSGAADATVSV
jgi:hypothetical protein